MSDTGTIQMADDTRDGVLHSSTYNPVPGNFFAGFFEGVGARQLRYAVFRSDVSLAKGTVVLLHGRNEFIEKYYETINELTAQGLWVATFDYRGQGGSERLVPKHPRRGHVGRFDHYVQDLELFLERVVLPDTRLPFYMLAHSTGGLIALKAAPRLANRIDRMVLTAPFVGLGPQKLSIDNIKRLTTLMRWTGFGARCLTAEEAERPFEGNALTTDPKRFARNQALMRAYPELTVGPPTARWLHEALKTIEEVRNPRHLASITVPTVLLAPGNDPIVPYIYQESLAQYFRAAQLVPVPGARHEILQEADRYRNQAMAAFKAFIPGGEPESGA